MRVYLFYSFIFCISVAKLAYLALFIIPSSPFNPSINPTANVAMNNTSHIVNEIAPVTNPAIASPFPGFLIPIIPNINASIEHGIDINHAHHNTIYIIPKTKAAILKPVTFEFLTTCSSIFFSILISPFKLLYVYIIHLFLILVNYIIFLNIVKIINTTRNVIQNVFFGYKNLSTSFFLKEFII